MFDPKDDHPCSSCSYWNDNFSGSFPHINRKTNLIAVAKADHTKLKALRARKRWPHAVYSSFNNTFNADFGVERTPDELKTDKLNSGYNFGDGSKWKGQMPGISVFYKSPATSIVYRVYGVFARGLDEVNGANHLHGIHSVARRTQTAGKERS